MGQTRRVLPTRTTGGQGPHTHHIRLTNVRITWDMSAAPYTLTPVTTMGFQINGTVSLVTGNGTNRHLRDDSAYIDAAGLRHRRESRSPSRIRISRWRLGGPRHHTSGLRPSMASCVKRQPGRSGICNLVDEWSAGKFWNGLGSNKEGCCEVVAAALQSVALGKNQPWSGWRTR